MNEERDEVMSTLRMSNMDEVTMRLVHYFVTKENYQPIVVNGLENEIWLENSDKHYEVIRINSNYIHNNEQLEFDLFKAKTIIKQIRKKMLSFKCNTLNILLNVGDNVSDFESKYKNMEVLNLDMDTSLEENEKFTSIFPEIKNDIIESSDDMDFFINVTQDINETTEKKNKLFEKLFKKKTIIVTYALIAINLLVYLLQVSGIINTFEFATSGVALRANRFFVLITAAFLHSDIIHLACNMYSLYIIGTQIETVLGKIKFLIVYFISAIVGSLLSGVLTNGASIGASGAIFGLLGALLYFGYHYRLYLGNLITSQIIPVILLNLFLGFMMPGIDNFGHIGGLIGGVLSAMIVGVEGKNDKSDRINGAVILTIVVAFLCYMIFR